MVLAVAGQSVVVSRIHQDLDLQLWNADIVLRLLAFSRTSYFFHSMICDHESIVQLTCFHSRLPRNRTSAGHKLTVTLELFRKLNVCRQISGHIKSSSFLILSLLCYVLIRCLTIDSLVSFAPSITHQTPTHDQRHNEGSCVQGTGKGHH